MTDTIPTPEEALIDGRCSCVRCKAQGRLWSPPWTSQEGTRYAGYWYTCLCNGRGYWMPVDVDAILKAVLSVRKPGRLVSAAPRHDARAYYVWRLTRFHTGADVTMPMTASCRNHGDPFLPVLDRMAEKLAERMTGHGSAGVARWRSAMLGEATPNGLPMSAESGGPVVLDRNKPGFEMAELH